MNGSVFVLDGLARVVARVSLLGMFAAFAAYTAAYVVLLVGHRIPAWTSAAAFLRGRGRPWFRLLTFCQGCAFVTPLLFVGFAASLDAAAVHRYEAVTRIALSSAIAYAVLSSVYYFVQAALVRTDLSGGRVEGLSQLFQLNPASVFTAVNVLGWTVFFAVACLCLGVLLAWPGGSPLLGALLLANGLVCVLGAAGYLGRVRVLSVLYFNGMGLAVLAFSLAGVVLL